jgi:uncharacterized protein (TIGR02757 family)
MNSNIISPTRGRDSIRAFLDRKVAEYNRPAFITGDPISIPHQYVRKQDIEIAAFFTAIFSWGNRTLIIRKTEQLMQLMDHAPSQFVLQHSDRDLQRLLSFRHRTFNATDLLYFIAFLRHHYSHHKSLEDAFLLHRGAGWQAGPALTAFYHYFFSLEAFSSDPGQNMGPRRKPANDWPSAGGPPVPLAPPRTSKHIATPEKNSACKRLNMFLRWMVRQDDKGVDFGLWRRIPASRLICPLDLHVARVARRFGLLLRKQSDWLAAQELTDHLLELDPADPTKYDFALFGLGIIEKF